MGAVQQIVRFAAKRSRARSTFSVSASGNYRLFVIVICGLLTLALQLVLAKTRFGSRLRAAVDDSARGARPRHRCRRDLRRSPSRSARGLAGLGGALGARDLRPRSDLSAQIHDLFPDRRCRRRHHDHHRPVPRLDLLGVADVAGKYYVPALGGFVIYTIMIVVLILRPQGLFARARRGDADEDRAIEARRHRAYLPRRARWRRSRSRSGSSRSRPSGCFPSKYLILKDTVILGAVRAVARSHPRLRRHHLAWPARIFRPRRLCAGLLAKHGIVNEPMLALSARRRSSRRRSASSRASWCCAAPI